MSNPNPKIENLIPASKRSKEEVRKNSRKGGIKSGEVRREKKLLSQMYADILSEKHGIAKDLSIKDVVKAIISRMDAPAVSMLREIRQATEGDKINIESNSFAEWVKSIAKSKKTN